MEANDIEALHTCGKSLKAPYQTATAPVFSYPVHYDFWKTVTNIQPEPNVPKVLLLYLHQSRLHLFRHMKIQKGQDYKAAESPSVNVPKYFGYRLSIQAHNAAFRHMLHVWL